MDRVRVGPCSSKPVAPPRADGERADCERTSGISESVVARGERRCRRPGPARRFGVLWHREKCPVPRYCSSRVRRMFICHRAESIWNVREIPLHAGGVHGEFPREPVRRAAEHPPDYRADSRAACHGYSQRNFGRQSVPRLRQSRRGLRRGAFGFAACELVDISATKSAAAAHRTRRIATAGPIRSGPPAFSGATSLPPSCSPWGRPGASLRRALFVIPSKRTCTGRSCANWCAENACGLVRGCAGCASLADSPGVREGVAPLEELFAHWLSLSSPRTRRCSNAIRPVRPQHA